MSNSWVICRNSCFFELEREWPRIDHELYHELYHELNLWVIYGNSCLLWTWTRMANRELGVRSVVLRVGRCYACDCELDNCELN